MKTHETPTENRDSVTGSRALITPASHRVVGGASPRDKNSAEGETRRHGERLISSCL